MHPDSASADRVARARRIDRWSAAALVGGAGLALQARLNGELGSRLNSPIASSAVNFVTGLVVAVVVLCAKAAPSRSTRLRERLRSFDGHWWYWIGGLCGATFVYAVVTTTPRLGVSLVSVAVAAGAVVGGMFADGVGLSTSGRHSLSWPRLVGASLTVAAVLVSASSRHVGGNAGDFALAAVGGFALGCQHPINSRLGRALGEPSFAVVVSFVIGAAATVALALRHWPTGDWPLNPALYAGGVIAAAYVFAAIRIVGRIGALRLSLATLTGQMFGAALLDRLAPISGRELTTAAIIGVGIAVAGVAISSLTKSGTPSMD